MKMRPTRRSAFNTSKSFGPQSMAPRLFLFACLRFSVRIEAFALCLPSGGHVIAVSRGITALI